MKQKDRVRNPKPGVLQLFCKHSGKWFTDYDAFANSAVETRYKACTKCGKILDVKFIPRPDIIFCPHTDYR